MVDPRPPFFTIGHSDRSIEAFIGLLCAPGVERVVDVRKIPMSRANPQFNEAALADALAACRISYEHAPALGGLRRRTPGLPPEVNGLWENRSFHNYADYALSAEFRAGLDHLIAAGREQRCAIMCSEAVWWRCHRRLVADNLIARGETVFHILAQARLDPARLTPGAVVRPDGSVLYPSPASVS